MDWNEVLRLVAPPVEAALTGLPFYIVVLTIGLVIGVLTGFFGVGGGFLIVPLLNIALDINYELAVGSSLSFIIGTSFAGLLKQNEQKNVHFEVAGYIVAGSVVGAVFGDNLQIFLLTGLAGGRQELFTLIMHGLFLLVLIGTIVSIRSPAAGDRPDKLPLLARTGPPPKFHISEWGSHGFSVPGTFLVGGGIGVLTGLLGIGGGVLLVPVLLGLFGLSHTKAAGTSLAIIFATSIVAVAKKGLSAVPKVSLPLTLILLIASVIGVQLGIYLVHRVSGAGFRRSFSYVLLAAIVLILMDAVSILT
ncbi:MAG: sulfite exporter TauE/SafE family protein [Spirochaetota bacterium]|nr:sulfite exporter TauE/SafE family protein [Spirochaetota bacterium]